MEPNFYYVDAIRDKDGNLRSWEDYKELTAIEDISNITYGSNLTLWHGVNRKREIDNAKRGRV